MCGTPPSPHKGQHSSGETRSAPGCSLCPHTPCRSSWGPPCILPPESRIRLFFLIIFLDHIPRVGRCRTCLPEPSFLHGTCGYLPGRCLQMQPWLLLAILKIRSPPSSFFHILRFLPYT